MEIRVGCVGEEKENKGDFRLTIRWFDNERFYVHYLVRFPELVSGLVMVQRVD